MISNYHQTSIISIERVNYSYNGGKIRRFMFHQYLTYSLQGSLLNQKRFFKSHLGNAKRLYMDREHA